jgi:hypothetical protein
MNLFEKTIIEVANLIPGTPMNEMATLTIGKNRIPGYSTINITINANSENPIPGARSEHDPPHFHMMDNGFDVSISIPDYEIMSVGINKNKALKIRNEKEPSWETSGQMNLKRALTDWLALTSEGCSNERKVFTTWNTNKGSLSTAYFNRAQTEKFVSETIADFAGILIPRVALRKNILRNSFINANTLDQVLDQLEIK